MSKSFNEVLNRFIVKNLRGNQAQAICPVHNDKQPSLSIKYDSKNNKILFKCQAGCNTEDILNAVGLTFSDLGSEKELKVNDPNIDAVYSYYDENKKLLFEKVRFKPTKNKPKSFSQRRYVNGDTVWGLDSDLYYETRPGSNTYSKKVREGARQKHFQEQQPSLYNLPKLINAIKEGFIVYIVEGEKDADTMSSMGLVATTPSNGAGPGKWLNNYSKYFRGARVVILTDNDETGKKFGIEIKSKIRNYAHSIKVYTISDKEKGDITDWINEGHTKEEFKEIIEEIEWDYAPWIINDKNKLRINQGVLAKCIEKTLDFILVGNMTDKSTDIYIYINGVYKEISKNNFKKYIKDYIPVEMQTNSMISNVAELALQNDTVSSNDLIGKDHIINLNNCLYNVDDNTIIPHSSKYKSDTQLTVSYNEYAENKGYWDKFINTLLSGHKENIAILQEWCGLILSNYNAAAPKKIMLLKGPGDTGKSKVIDVLADILGESNSKVVDVQKLGDRFALGNILNKRLIFNGDLPSAGIKDEALAMMKQITGSDKITTEKKGKDSIDLKFRGALMYATNHIPIMVGDNGKHVFNRLLILQCCDSIPLDKQDPMLLKKLLSEKEYIFQWSLEGLKRLINNNFKFTYSESVEEAKVQAERNSDSVVDFIEECYVITEHRKDRVKVNELYLKYENWCLDNGKISCAKNTFSDRLLSKYSVKINPKYCGYKQFEYIKEVIPEMEEVIDEKELQHNPF
nr:MAG: helicase [Bacteriophage sp.]